MLPPIMSTNSRQIARPSPLPTVRLLEALEQARLAGLGNARAGVDDAEQQALGRALRTQGDVAVLGELQGVVGQVQQHLLDPQCIAEQLFG
jgi:hypothetical protein